MCGVILQSLLSEESRIYIAQNAPMLLLSNIVAFIAGSLAIKWALNFLKRDDALKYFGWYRVILATIIIIFQLLK
jgi:undecaprenyl pyrophosphate phosphatase UppP